VDQRVIDEYKRLIEAVTSMVVEAAMDGVCLEMPVDPALAELRRIYALESPEGL